MRKVRWWTAGYLTVAIVALVWGAFRNVGRRPIFLPNDTLQRINPFPPSVPLQDLIATPEKYHHKKIRTAGYVRYSFELCAIYPRRDDYRHSGYQRSLWLDGIGRLNPVEPEKVNGKYCIVEGIVDCESHGNLGGWSAAIGTINHLEVRSDLAEKP